MNIAQVSGLLTYTCTVVGTVTQTLDFLATTDAALETFSLHDHKLSRSNDANNDNKSYTGSCSISALPSPISLLK